MGHRSAPMMDPTKLPDKGIWASFYACLTSEPPSRVVLSAGIAAYHARPADQFLVAEDRSAGGVRDSTGPGPAAHEIAHETRRDTPGRTGTGRDDAMPAALLEGLVEP